MPVPKESVPCVMIVRGVKKPRPERHKPTNPRKSRLGASKSIPSNPNILKLSLALSLGA
jgi:hypothetical protein